MNCADLKDELSFYAAGESSTAVEAHLASCPICREDLYQERRLLSELRRMSSPQLPQFAVAQIRSRIAAERSSKGFIGVFPSAFREYLLMRVMPTAVGVVATLIVGFTVLIGMLTSADNAVQEFGRAANRPSNDAPLMLSMDTGNDVAETVLWVSPDDYARQRRDVSFDSPSLNPNGPLIALSRTLMPTIPTDDEVVVIAEIDANGRAQIAQVVESPIDGQLLARLERAFESRDSAAPFVPAGVDMRPRSMRVVFKFQSVSVSATGQ